MTVIIEMICGSLMTLLGVYVYVAYKIWDLSENDSEIGKLTLRDFAKRLYCTHKAVRLFEARTEEQEA